MIAVVFLLVAGTSGCFPNNETRPIPAGIYYAESGDEWIRVSATTLYFHVKFTIDQPTDEYIDREYAYWVGTDSHIFLAMSSNDWVFMDFFPNPWYWEDGIIVKRVYDSNQTIWFIKRDK